MRRSERDMATDAEADRATDPRSGHTGAERKPRFSTTDILQGAGAAAGTTAVIYVIGGMVMWLRFRKAGLPADQAVALMERQQLLVIGLRLMVLPAALTGVLAWLVMRLANQPARMPARVRTVVKTVLVTLAVAFALVLPFSFASATWVLAALLVVGYLRYERRPVTSPEPEPEPQSPAAPTSDGPDGAVRAARERLIAVAIRLRARWAKARLYLPLKRRPEGRPASPLIATMLVVAVAAVVSLGRQLDQPVQLLDSTVRLQEGAGSINGVWISSDGDEVFLGVDDGIRAIPRATVRDVTLGPPRERAPSPSLLSRALGGNRYAITPFDWWCNGERYAWDDVGDLCRTQIEVVKPDEEALQRRDLAGDAVPVTLRCPAAATRPCRGFLRLSSSHRYQLGPAALPKPLTFRSPVKPAGTEASADTGIAPGQAKVVCVPVDQGQRGLLRKARPVGDPTALDEGTGKRPLPFRLTISADEAGGNVVRSERYVVSVTRPTQPIEYWGECSTLSIACRAVAGTRAEDAIRCTVTGKRKFTGDLTVSIVDGPVRYARGKAVMNGKVQVVNPKVTRALRPEQEYQATALLGYGGNARTFWAYFRASAR